MFPFAVARLQWSLLSDQDVPGVLPAQGLEFGGGQRWLPVAQGAEGAVHKVHRGEPAYHQGTEHALEQHRSAMREGKSTQVTSRLAKHFIQKTCAWPGFPKGKLQSLATAGRTNAAACPGDSPGERTVPVLLFKKTIVLKPNTCRDDH